MDNYHSPGNIETLEIIDHHEHLSEIEYYPLTDTELGELVYYEALSQHLSERDMGGRG